jgi:hypothetical protein
MRTQLAIIGSAFGLLGRGLTLAGIDNVILDRVDRDTSSAGCAPGCSSSVWST